MVVPAEQERARVLCKQDDGDRGESKPVNHTSSPSLTLRRFADAFAVRSIPFLKPEHSESTSKIFPPAFLTHHLVELFLFLARIWPVLAYYIARYVAWMESAPKVVVGESGSILRADCRVSTFVIACVTTLLTPVAERQFAQHTTEWAIPYEHAQACLIELRDWLETEPYSENGTYPNFPIELRFSAPDDIWLSPAYGRRTCWIGIIQFK